MNQKKPGRVGQVNKQIKELIGIYRDAVKNMDVSESEFWVLYTLVAMEGDYTQQDICRMWSLPKQTVNTVITQLKKKKFATLETVPDMRNHKFIRLTEAGRKYGETVVLPISRAEERAASKTMPKEVNRITRLFGRYIALLKRELCGTTN